MRTGILLTAFGGPDSLDAVGPFMRNLMGREPAPEIVARAQGKYAAIGGASPLPERTAQIAERLAERLREDGHDVDVVVGMRYWHPTIGEGFDELAAAGARRVVQLSLSPFESAVSSGAYRAAVLEAAKAHDLPVVEAASFYDAQGFLDALTEGARDAIDDIVAERPLVIFSAHSLPVRDIEADPRYLEQLREATAAVAQRLELAPGAPDTEVLPGVSAFGSAGERPWVFAFQSKGVAPGEWLGPMLEDVMDAAKANGFDGVAVCPVGFGTDHMETLYDLDVVAAQHAIGEGLAFTRAAVPNASPLMIDALASRLEPLLED